MAASLEQNSGSVQREYDRNELEVLQVPLDLYRNLPEVLSPKSCILSHSFGRAEAARRLAQEGILSIKEVEGELNQAAKGLEDVLLRKAEASPTCTDFWTRLNPDDVHKFYHGAAYNLPGVQAQLTEKGVEVVVELFKQGKLKKNKW